MESISVLVVGIGIIIVGIINICGDIRTVHWYHRRRVTEEDAPRYGRVIGAGTLVIGAGLILGAALEPRLGELGMLLPLVIGIAVGLGLILYGQIRYNRGIF